MAETVSSTTPNIYCLPLHLKVYWPLVYWTSPMIRCLVILGAKNVAVNEAKSLHHEAASLQVEMQHIQIGYVR